MQGYVIDKKAKDILFKKYWSTTGWETKPIEPTDFQYAKSKGVMFDSITIEKSELVENLRELLKKISKDDIAKAFLSSFSTKQLELRSAIGSYANALRIINGKKMNEFDLPEKYVDEDLNVLNFERLKWGGVRHGQALYNYLDLTLFSRIVINKPQKEDLEIFNNILKAISESAHGETPSKLSDRLKDVFKSSKNERDNLIEILACCKILQPASYDRYSNGRNDWGFAEYWRGEDKYDLNMVNYYFQGLI